MKTYLGDGVYVQFLQDQFQFLLTANDGSKDTDFIFLDSEVCLQLIDFIESKLGKESTGLNSGKEQDENQALSPLQES